MNTKTIWILLGIWMILTALVVVLKFKAGLLMLPIVSLLFIGYLIYVTVSELQK